RQHLEDEDDSSRRRPNPGAAVVVGAIYSPPPQTVKPDRQKKSQDPKKHTNHTTPLVNNTPRQAQKHKITQHLMTINSHNPPARRHRTGPANTSQTHRPPPKTVKQTSSEGEILPAFNQQIVFSAGGRDVLPQNRRGTSPFLKQRGSVTTSCSADTTCEDWK
ncbi:hypothetical protein, partial [Stappia taiwanensis]